LTVKQSAALAACVLRATTKKRSSTFSRKKVHRPEKILATSLTLGDLAWGFSDLEITWLLYCAGAATDSAWSVPFKMVSTHEDGSTLKGCGQFKRLLKISVWV